MLCMMGFYCLLQSKKGLLLLLMLPLHLTVLFLKHFSVILENVRALKPRLFYKFVTNSIGLVK